MPHIAAESDFSWVRDWDMSDEFEKQVDNVWLRRYRWHTTNATWRGRPPSFFRKENVVVRNDSMQLWAREEERPYNYPTIYKHFSTAFVTTKHKRLYGFFQIHCRLMDSRISSAFWLANNESTRWTELDVFEYSTSDKVTRPEDPPFCNRFNTNMHVHRHPYTDVSPYSRPKYYDLGFDLSKEPITAAINWQRDSIEWYVNRVLVRKEPNLHFHQPLYLQLDSETFPKWFGLPDLQGRNNLPNNFEIFNVRTWYKVPNKYAKS